MWPLVPRPALDGAEGDRETGVLLSGFSYTLVPDPGPDELLFPLKTRNDEVGPHGS